MSETVLARESDVVVRELADLTRDVVNARRVLIVGAARRPLLIDELNRALIPLGIMCQETVPGIAQDFEMPPAYHPQPPTSYGDLLASPGLSRLLDDPPSQVVEPAPAVLEELAPQTQPDPVPAPEPAPLPAPKPPRPDMSKPENWEFGDIFTENPRFTMLHLRKKWIFIGVDSDGVELRSQSSDTTELLSIDQFMRGYVFHARGTESTAI